MPWSLPIITIQTEAAVVAATAAPVVADGNFDANPWPIFPFDFANVPRIGFETFAFG